MFKTSPSGQRRRRIIYHWHNNKVHDFFHGAHHVCIEFYDYRCGWWEANLAKFVKRASLSSQTQEQVCWYVILFQPDVYYKIFVHIYTDGQSIAIRLSRRINVVTKQLKLKLEIFSLTHSAVDKLTWEDVTQFNSSAFPESLHDSLSNTNSPPVLISTVMSSDSDDELEIQHWRKEMFLRDEYIQSHMV